MSEEFENDQTAPQEPVGTGAALDDMLALLHETVTQAKNMPLSSSALVDRKALLAIIEDARRSLPSELTGAREIIRDRDGLLGAAKAEAERGLERARHARDEAVSESEVVQAASREADRIVHEAKQAAALMRTEAEEYVEAKLANFEVVLQKTLQMVERGRAKMVGMLEADRLVAEDPFED